MHAEPMTRLESTTDSLQTASGKTVYFSTVAHKTVKVSNCYTRTSTYPANSSCIAGVGNTSQLLRTIGHPA